MPETTSTETKISVNTFSVGKLSIDVDKQISESKPMKFDWPVIEIDQANLSQLGSKGKKIVLKVLALDGVLSITISRYQITVCLGNLFNNNTVYENILQIIEEIFPDSSVIGAGWRPHGSM